MSVPATNAWPPAPRSTRTRIASSASTSAQARARPSYMLHVSALRAAGRLKVSVMIGPSRAIRISSVPTLVYRSPCRSARRHAPVDQELRTGHEARVVGSVVEDAGSDGLGLADAA